MKIPVSENVNPENTRFYVITQIAYIVVAVCHLGLGFRFLWMGITEMVLFNFILSVPIFTTALVLNWKGRHALAFSMAFFELLFHQVAGVYYLGWDLGFQYTLIYLAGLTFFNARWSKFVRISLIIVISSSYSFLFLFFRDAGVYKVSQAYSDFSYLASALFTLLGIALLVSYYVRAAVQSETDLRQANQKLSEKNEEIEKALHERNQALFQLNQELAEAADYVRTILPQPITEGAISTDWRYIPSTSLGGDAFGYHQIDGDHFAIYLIDVSGHGVGAALLSVSVMNMLRSQSLPETDFKDPEQVLTTLNAAFPGEENNDMFFTMWYGVYNKITRELTYASGGHPPALFFDKDKDGEAKVTLLRTANQALGATPDVSYEKDQHIVGENTTLYIFSDGVYEVEKSDGSMWQFEEFAAFMNNMKSRNQSRLDRLHQYADTINLEDNFADDFTILEVAFG